MDVICIEGCHGSGKTQITKILGADHNVIDEGFLDMPQYDISPQSFTMELLWVARWFERLLKIKSELTHQQPIVKASDNFENNATCKHKVFFADRSPYSALFYAPNGTLMRNVINESKAELVRQGINIKTVYVKVDNEILWNRITKRLEKEPERKKYNEDSRDWMQKTVNFYETQNLWDVTLENNTTLDEIVSKVKNFTFQ